jgi:hypothetical protein
MVDQKVFPIRESGLLPDPWAGSLSPRTPDAYAAPSYRDLLALFCGQLDGIAPTAPIFWFACLGPDSATH